MPRKPRFFRADVPSGSIWEGRYKASLIHDENRMPCIKAPVEQAENGVKRIKTYFGRNSMAKI